MSRTVTNTAKLKGGFRRCKEICPLNHVGIFLSRCSVRLGLAAGMPGESPPNCGYTAQRAHRCREGHGSYKAGKRTLFGVHGNVAAIDGFRAEVNTWKFRFESS
jgi:hypothetical protein